MTKSKTIGKPIYQVAGQVRVIADFLQMVSQSVRLDRCDHLRVLKVGLVAGFLERALGVLMTCRGRVGACRCRPCS